MIKIPLFPPYINSGSASEAKEHSRKVGDWNRFKMCIVKFNEIQMPSSYDRLLRYLTIYFIVNDSFYWINIVLFVLLQQRTFQKYCTTVWDNIYENVKIIFHRNMYMPNASLLTSRIISKFHYLENRVRKDSKHTWNKHFERELLLFLCTIEY